MWLGTFSLCADSVQRLLFFEFMDAWSTIPNTCARKRLPLSFAVYFQCFGLGRTSIVHSSESVKTSWRISLSYRDSHQYVCWRAEVLHLFLSSVLLARQFFGNVHIMLLLESPLWRNIYVQCFVRSHRPKFESIIWVVLSVTTMKSATLVGACMVVAGVARSQRSRLHWAINWKYRLGHVLELLAGTIWKDLCRFCFGKARREIWHQNMLYIMMENEKDSACSLGVSLFSDFTKEEFTSAYLGYKPQNMSKLGTTLGWFQCDDDILDLPSDWEISRSHGGGRDSCERPP